MIRKSLTAMAGTALLALGLSLTGATAATAAEADTIHGLVNQARWDNGLNGLVRSSALDAVATDWAHEMAAGGSLKHNPNLSTDIPSGWTAAAENVATGYSSAAAVHQGWMESSGHRANILGGFTDIGIAFISAHGTTWGVQVFATYSGHSGPPPPQAAQPAQPEPDPQPTEIEDPTVKPTLTPLPTDTASATPSPTATTPAPTRSPDGPGGNEAGDQMALVTWLIVLAALAAVGAVLGLLALSRRNTTRASQPDADDQLE